jgi:uncharacterized membrane protein YgcG
MSVAARNAVGSRELQFTSFAWDGGTGSRAASARVCVRGTGGGYESALREQSRYGENVGAVRELPDRAQHAAPLHFNSAAPAFTFFGPRGTKQSEVFPVRSLTVTENDVALPAERGNLEYAGLSLVYEANRVKSALLGRDLNPLGRGDGDFYPAGAFGLTQVTVASLVAAERPNLYATGNSANNQGQCGSKDCPTTLIPMGISPNKGLTPTPPGPPTQQPWPWWQWVLGITPLNREDCGSMGKRCEGIMDTWYDMLNQYIADAGLYNQWIEGWGREGGPYARLMQDYLQCLLDNEKARVYAMYRPIADAATACWRTLPSYCLGHYFVYSDMPQYPLRDCSEILKQIQQVHPGPVQYWPPGATAPGPGQPGYTPPAVPGGGGQQPGGGGGGAGGGAGGGGTGGGGGGGNTDCDWLCTQVLNNVSCNTGMFPNRWAECHGECVVDCQVTPPPWDESDWKQFESDAMICCGIKATP